MLIRMFTLVFMLLIAAPISVRAETIAFANVNVIAMDRDEVRREQTVIVTDGVITAIAPTAELDIPEGARTIDGTGQYLIPGLADMHAHLGLRLPGETASPQEIASDLSLYLPHGVTTVRHMRGTPDILELRDRIRASELSGPRLIVAGPSLNASLPPDFGPRATTPEEAEAAVRGQAEAGYDLIKVHQELPPEAFDTVLEIANALGLPVAGHAQKSRPAAQSLRMDSLEHMEEVTHLLGDKSDFSEAAGTLSAFQDGRAMVTPTLIVFETIHRYLNDDDLAALFAAPETALAATYWHEAMSPERNFFRQSMGENWANNHSYFREEAARLATLTLQLHEANVPLMLGTDAVGLVAPGISTHQELALLVEAGLTPFEALVTATVNPASWLGESETRGRILPGMDADLVLLRENPLEDIAATRTIQGVMRRGVWHDRETLERALTVRRNQ